MNRFCLFLAAWFLATPAGFAQPLPMFRVGPVYAPHFPDLEIVLEATPQAGSNNDLVFRPGDLILTEDGVQTKKATGVKAFRQTGQGVAVMLSLDASGSMRGKPLEAVREGLSEFVSQARPYDRVSVQTFADDARLEATWTTPPDQIRRKIESIQTRGQYTRLWDALDAALTELEREELPLRKRLVVISDGHDEGSAKTLAQVIAHAVRLRIPVDSIGITRSDSEYLRNLASLSQSTQGSYRQAPDTDALKQYVSGGIQRLLDSPVAFFTASRIRADGQTHNVGVYWNTTNQTDLETIVVPRRGPAWLPAWLPTWLPMWIEGWHLVVAGLAVLGVLAFLISRRFTKRRRRAGALPPPLPQTPNPAAEHSPNFLPGSPTPAFVEKPVRVSPTPPPPSAARRAKTEFAVPFEAPATGKPVAFLRGLQGPGAGKLIAIDRPEFWIGSSANNTFCADYDPGVSGNHLCIRFEGASLKIYDNRSANNTWVNRQAVGETARLLSPGDQIQFGQSVYSLEVPSSEVLPQET